MSSYVVLPYAIIVGFLGITTFLGGVEILSEEKSSSTWLGFVFLGCSLACLIMVATAVVAAV